MYTYTFQLCDSAGSLFSDVYRYSPERSSHDRQEQNIQLPTRTSDFLSFVSRLSEPLGFTAKIRDMVLNPALYLGFFQLRITALR